MACNNRIPMFNIPETFSKALSYEAQIHVLRDAVIYLREVYDKIDIEQLNNVLQELQELIDEIGSTSYPETIQSIWDYLNSSNWVTSGKIADGAITLAKMSDGNARNMWSYSAIWANKNVVFFGDSFLAPNIDNSEQEFVATNIANILNMNKFNFAVAGAGFARPSNLISSQQTTCDSTMTQDEKLNTALVVCMAGCNDLLNLSDENINQASIVDGIHNFINWANQTFNHARIVIVPFNWGFSKLTYGMNYLIANCMNSINTLLHGKGCILVPYAWTWNIGIAGRFRNEVHPNQTGYRVISNHILNACMGSEINNFCTGGFINLENENINSTSKRCVYNSSNGIVNINGFIRPLNAITGASEEYTLVDVNSLPAICTPNNSFFILPLISSTSGKNVGYIMFKSNGSAACRFVDVNANEVCNFNGSFMIEVGVNWNAYA